MCKPEKTIIAYCGYCKDSVYTNEDYVVHKSNHYHRFCYDVISVEEVIYLEVGEE